MTRGRRSVHADCECVCHEDWGGSAHPRQKCRCRPSGSGFETLTVFLAVRIRRGLALPPLRIIDDDIIEVRG